MGDLTCAGCVVAHGGVTQAGPACPLRHYDHTMGWATGPNQTRMAAGPGGTRTRLSQRDSEGWTCQAGAQRRRDAIMIGSLRVST